jgi:hypothetical protein
MNAILRDALWHPRLGLKKALQLIPRAEEKRRPEIPITVKVSDSHRTNYNIAEIPFIPRPFYISRGSRWVITFSGHESRRKRRSITHDFGITILVAIRIAFREANYRIDFPATSTVLYKR